MDEESIILKRLERIGRACDQPKMVEENIREVAS